MHSAITAAIAVLVAEIVSEKGKGCAFPFFVLRVLK
jgi:hypothetical protein